MKSFKKYPIFLALFWMLGNLSPVVGHHDSVATKKSQANPALKLSPEDQHVLKEQFVELPSVPVPAEDFQGIPLNNAHPEFFMYADQFILLNFWATWCIPCLKELPDMERLHEALGKKGLVVLAVGMGESEETIKKFLEKHDLTFPIIADPEMEISELYGVRNLPITFLINREGEIIGRALGPREWDNPDLVAFFTRQINASH